MKTREHEEEEEVEDFSGEEEEDHSTKLRLNASNVTNLDIFSTNVLHGRRK